MRVVLDTNVLVSALWSRQSEPARVLALVQNGKITPGYDYRILAEYREVLSRAKFNFAAWEICDLLALIEQDGLSVTPKSLGMVFTDLDDKPFYEAAKYCQAKLITGNKKHFPPDPLVVSPKNFLESFNDWQS
jgi:putative PIN family toxin of toxin-antitoxin system